MRRLDLICFFVFFPFDSRVVRSSGSELFSWVDDRRVLEEGPFEWRLNHGPRLDLLESTFPPETRWRSLVNDVWRRRRRERASDAAAEVWGARLLVAAVLAFVASAVVALWFGVLEDRDDAGPHPETL